MNHRKLGTNISNYGNFTFRSTNDNNKMIRNDNFGSQQHIKKQEFGKATKRAPLGELHLNCIDNGYAADASQLPQVLPKKRAERFEIFIEEDEYFKKKSVETEFEQNNNQADKNASPENKPFEKENIPPPAEEESVVKAGSPLGSSFDEETDEEDTPSEYLTAKSCFSNLVPKSEKNPMYMSYDLDIYRWMLHREQISRPKSSYMSKQSQINEEMRAVLVDWYVDVIAEYHLSSASFFLAVSLTDRTLSIIDCPRDKLQLLGATAILVASKMQDIFPPTIKDIIFVTDESYNDEQVRRMEKIMLKVIDFQLNDPLIDSFAEFFIYFAHDSLDQFARHLMWYLLELCTLEFNFVCFLPSRIAAAAFLLVSIYQQLLLNEGKITDKIWSDEMVKRTNIMREELSEPAFELIKCHQKESSQTQSIRKKYASSKRCKVSSITLPEFEQIVSQFSDEI